MRKNSTAYKVYVWRLDWYFVRKGSQSWGQKAARSIRLRLSLVGMENGTTASKKVEGYDFLIFPSVYFS
jgi:hypothetical protein